MLVETCHASQPAAPQPARKKEARRSAAVVETYRRFELIAGLDPWDDDCPSRSSKRIPNGGRGPPENRELHLVLIGRQKYTNTTIYLCTE